MRVYPSAGLQVIVLLLIVKMVAQAVHADAVVLPDVLDKICPTLHGILQAQSTELQVHRIVSAACSASHGVCTGLTIWKMAPKSYFVLKETDTKCNIILAGQIKFSFPD